MTFILICMTFSSGKTCLLCLSKCTIFAYSDPAKGLFKRLADDVSDEEGAYMLYVTLS